MLSAREEQNAQVALCRALLAMRTVDDCRAFLADLCTPAELQAMTDRWAVAQQLADGLSYRRIHELTGVSVTTIGRVARYLNGGAGGYARALQRMKK